MPFTSPQEILKFQTTLENIFVANVQKAFDRGIKEAFRKSKRAEDIHKHFSLQGTPGIAWQFIWSQAMYGGITDCEKEIDLQRKNKTSNFSLSDNFTQIIEFAKKKKKSETETQIELLTSILSKNNDENDIRVAKAFGIKRVSDVTDEDRQNFRDRLQQELISLQRKQQVAEVQETVEKVEARTLSPEEKAFQKKQNQLKYAREKRDKARKKVSQAQETAKSLKKVGGESLLKAFAGVDLATQREIERNLSNRYSAIKDDSYFATQYLSKRGEIVSSLLQQQMQEDLKNKVAAYIRSNKNTARQTDLLKDLTSLYNPTKLNEVQKAESILREKLSQTTKPLTRGDIDRFVAKLDDNPQIRNLDRDIEIDEEDIEAIKQELGRLDPNSSKYKKNREDLLEIRKQIRDKKLQRNDLATQLEREAFGSSADQILNKILRQEDKKRQNLRQRESQLSQFDNELEELKALKKKSSASIAEALGLPKESKEAVKLLNSKIRDLSTRRDALSKNIAKTRESLANDTTGISTTRNEKINLSDTEIANITKWLNLKDKGEIEKLKKPLTRTQIKRLIDTANRRKNVFLDEKAVALATRTAVTEITAAYNIGRLEAFKQAGVRYVQWISTIDSVTSVFCRSLHLKVFPLDDVMARVMFITKLPDTDLQEWHPTNRALSPRGIWIPPAHPHCRSYWYPVYLPEDEKYLERDIGNKRVSDEILTEKRILADKSNKGKIEKLLSRQEGDSKARQTSFLRKLLSSKSLYERGLSLILNKLREDGIANFKESEIKKNDKALVGALLTGGAVLSAGAMMYFFTKSGFIDSLNNYVRSTLSSGIASAKDFLAGRTQAEILNIVSKVIQEIEDLPDSIKNELTPLDLKKRPLELPLVLKNKEGEVPISLNDSLARGEAGYALSLNGIPIDDAVDSLLSNNQISLDAGLAFRSRVYKEVFNRTRTQSNLLRKQVYDIVGENLGDIGLVANIDDIEKLEVFSQGQISIKYKQSFLDRKDRGAAPTLLSGKRYQQALSNPKFTRALDSISTEAKRLENLLNDLQGSNPEDTLLRAKVRRELDTLRNLSSINKLNSLKKVPTLKASEAVMQEAYQSNILNNRRLQDLYAGIERYNKSAQQILQDFNDFLPPEKFFSILSESITDLSDLKYVESLLEESLENIERRFLKVNKNGFDVRAVEDLTDVSTTLADLEQNYSELSNTASFLDYRPNIGRINEEVQRQISSNYSFLLNQKIEVSKRIRELEP